MEAYCECRYSVQQISWTRGFCYDMHAVYFYVVYLLLHLTVYRLRLSISKQSKLRLHSTQPLYPIFTLHTTPIHHTSHQHHNHTSSLLSTCILFHKLFMCVVCTYVCKDSAAPAHARTRAHTGHRRIYELNIRRHQRMRVHTHSKGKEGPRRHAGAPACRYI